MDNIAIKIEHVSKVYKLYDKPSDRLKETLGLTRKKLSKDHHALTKFRVENAVSPSGIIHAARSGTRFRHFNDTILAAIR